MDNKDCVTLSSTEDVGGGGRVISVRGDGGGI